MLSHIIIILQMNMEDSTASDPSAFLSAIIGVPVTVKLNSGVVYKGIDAAQALYATAD